MKTIKGKIEFYVISAQNIEFLGNKTHKCDVTQEDAIFINEIRTVNNSFYLSEITEEQAGLLVEGYGIMYKSYTKDYEKRLLATAKESLFGLLKANGCLIKDWIQKPKYEDYKNQAYCYDFISDTDSYNKTPDDYLLIIKQ